MWNYLFNGGEIESTDGKDYESYRYDNDRCILINECGNEQKSLSPYYYYQKKEKKLSKTFYRRKWVKYAISGVLDNPNWFESKEQFDLFYKYQFMISYRSDEWETKDFELE